MPSADSGGYVSVMARVITLKPHNNRCKSTRKGGDFHVAQGPNPYQVFTSTYSMSRRVRAIRVRHAVASRQSWNDVVFRHLNPPLRPEGIFDSDADIDVLFTDTGLGKDVKKLPRSCRQLQNIRLGPGAANPLEQESQSAGG
jgi:hypothetical protein